MSATCGLPDMMADAPRQFRKHESQPLAHCCASDRERAWVEYLKRAAAGDADAFALLYDQTNHLVYGMARRILGDAADAEEIALDVYGYVWRSAGSYDSDRGNILTWLLMLTRSRAIDRLRSAPAGKLRDDAQQLADNVLPIAAASSIDNEQRLLITRALEQLPSEQQDLLDLAFYSGFSHHELASKLKLPLGTIKSRIRVALCHLRDLITGAETA